MIFCANTFAQNIIIKDASNEENLPGATLGFLLEGKMQFFSADTKGKFSIPTAFWAETDLLPVQVSFVGYSTLYDTLAKGKPSFVLRVKPKDFAMDEVVVTAQYGESSTEKSVHKVRVIGQEKMQQMAAVNLQDVLTNELNVRLSQDNILGSGMSLQGVSGQNVKILIDGVPVIGRLDGQIDLNQINLNDVERIEIVEGPLSVNYGSNALAGTINIITKKTDTKKWSFGASSYLENIGTYNFDAFASKRFGKRHFVRISGGRNYFDGWSPSNDFIPSFKAEKADSGRVDQWNPKEQWFGRAQYFYNLKALRLGYKAEILDETIFNYGLPREGVRTITAFDDYYHTQRIDQSLSAQGKLSKQLNLNFLAAYNDFERIKESRIKDLVTLESKLRPEVQGNDVQDTSTFSLIMSRASVTTNLDSSWINYEVGYDINQEQASGKRIDGGGQKLGDYAIFASTQMVKGGLTVKPAIRYAYNTKYDAPLTPALNLKYKMQNQVTIRFAYARGFRAPSLKELYFNFDDVNHSLFGNADLKAEESDNYSAAISRKHLFDKFLLEGEFSLFYNDIRNQINFANTNSAGGDTLVYLNIGEFKTKGLNARASIASKTVKFNLGYSYIGRFNRLSEEVSIDEFSYSSEWTANFTYSLVKSKMQFSVFFKHQGELPGFGYNTNDEIVEQRIASYQIVDVSLSKRFLDKRVHATMGCKNLFDVQNVRASLSGGGAHSSSASSISVGTGRTVFVKLNFLLSKS